jgi:NAD(P)-dependent dehydrogenase (short-subunit alcohol dehydrogenase family)
MRIFVAGASGLIGVRLVPLLVSAGHTVAGMTRSVSKADLLAGLGAEPVVCDVYDAPALVAAVSGFRPDVVIHQLTDLPDNVADVAAAGPANRRIRIEGTANLLKAAGDARLIAQSISWEQATEQARAGTGEFERMVLGGGGVVVRYGQFWGPGTYYPDKPATPRIHIDDAARLTLPALDAPPGVTLVVDDRTLP